MQTRVDLNFHNSDGWIVYPAGTTVKPCAIGTLSPKEQRTFNNILKDGLILVELGGKPRAISKDDLMQEQNMTDITAREKEAIKTAGFAGGEYMESIGKFDVRQLTVDEYITFIKCIVSTYQTEKARLDSRNFLDDIPF